MAQKTDRHIVVLVLMDIYEKRAYANIALRKALTDSHLDARSRAFVTDMVNETIRNLRQIDYILDKFSKIPVAEMRPFIRALMRMSVCQIKFMEEIPDSAAVNESIDLAKKHGFSNLAGFVNAVLRNIAAADMVESKDPAIKYSYPEWLMEKVFDWLGPEGAETFLKNSQTPPPVTVLTNTVKTTFENLQEILLEEGIKTTPLENNFLVLHKPGDISRLGSFKQGLFFVMDPGAIHAVNAMNPQPGQTIIDVCAAPGGKSFATAIKMQNQGTILAFDIHSHRVDLISQTSKKLGISIIHSKTKNSIMFDPSLENKADAVLLDAPCSGLGTIRKHPEIKYVRKMKDIIELSKTQEALISTAAKYVKPGGKLVYCTCTIATEENADIIEYFLGNHSEFKLVSSEQILPSAKSDAFFVAVLTRVE